MGAPRLRAVKVDDLTEKVEAEHRDERVTTVLLVGSCFERALEALDAWTRARGLGPGPVAIDAPALPLGWYITTGKGMGGDIAIGAYRDVDVDALAAFLCRFPWSDNEGGVQLCERGPDDAAFQLHPIWPISYYAEDLAAFGGINVFERTFGPATDPVLVFVDEPGDVEAPVLASLRTWLASGYPGSEIRPFGPFALASWGLWDDGKPRRGYVVTGTFDQVDCLAMYHHLLTVEWPQLGLLLTGSADGWRTFSGFATQLPAPAKPPEPVRRDLSVEEIRVLHELLVGAFPPERQTRPSRLDLGRLDKLLIRYMNTRGYQVMMAPRE